MHQLCNSISSWGDSRKDLETPSNVALEWQAKILEREQLIDGGLSSRGVCWGVTLAMVGLSYGITRAWERPMTNQENATLACRLIFSQIGFNIHDIVNDDLPDC
jgi:hypothetical protein